MSKRVKYVSAVVFVVSVALGAYFWFFWSPAGTIIRVKGYEGLVIDTRYSRPSSGPWRPQQEVIRRLEQELPKYVKSPALLASLPNYRRTYTGHTSKVDKKQIIVAEFHAPSLLSRRDWLNGVTINGGVRGDRWTVIYYPASNVFTTPLYFEYVAEPE
jgi:hypothetical protein